MLSICLNQALFLLPDDRLPCCLRTSRYRDGRAGESTRSSRDWQRISPSTVRSTIVLLGPLVSPWLPGKKRDLKLMLKHLLPCPAMSPSLDFPFPGWTLQRVFVSRLDQTLAALSIAWTRTSPAQLKLLRICIESCELVGTRGF